MFLYASGNFYRIQVIINISSMCKLSFQSSPLSSLSLVIHSLGYIFTSSRSHFDNFLRGLVLEAPVVGSNFPKSFTKNFLPSSHLLDFYSPLQWYQKDHILLCKYQIIKGLIKLGTSELVKMGLNPKLGRDRIDSWLTIQYPD